MKNAKRGVALIVLVAVVITTFFSEMTFNAKAAETDNYGDFLGVTDGSGAGIGREDTFTESWENGLDLDKWEVVKYNSSYVSYFAVVDDPIANGQQGKVLTTNRAGVWLMPTDEYYPNGALWGELKTIEFKAYLKDIQSWVNGGSGQSNEYAPGISFRAVTDNGTGEVLARRVDGYMAYPDFDEYRTGVTYEGASFRGDSMNGIKGLTTFDFIPTYVVLDTGLYTEAFDFTNWIDVKITIDKEGNAFGVFTDCNDVSYTADCGKYNQSGGKLALGYMPRSTHARNYTVSEQEWGGQLYLDDIKVTFQPSDFDRDEEAVDVDVYYEGNTYQSAGDTISLTGERLGNSVLSAQIAKLTDDAVTIEDAEYVPETHYDAYYDVDANAVWNQLNKGTVLSSTEVDGEFRIDQRSELGLNMTIPESLGDGMYALLLKASSANGEDELVIINNPRINLLMGDDGDCATYDGYLKIGGENLSVQNDADKVSAIILGENGEKLYLIQNTVENPDQIYVDTTENYGAETEHYMKVNLQGVELQAGRTYQIMVHNGYGGDYGWSMPKEFCVQDEASNITWRNMGIFNVLDYGAAGDGEANDTAAIQRAINAAVENGGGTIYFPKHADGSTSYYRITNGLIVKENISFVGDGSGHSKLYYDGYLKTSIEQTEYMISYERNFEITGLEIYCNTNYFNAAIKKSDNAKDKRGKLYVHNIKVLLDATAWRNNSFSPTLPDYEGKTSSEWYELLWLNQDRFFLEVEGASDEIFITYYNVDADLRYGGVVKGGSAEYADIRGWINQHDGGTTSSFSGETAFMEDVYDVYMKSNTLYRGVYMNKEVCNNREEFLADTGGVNTVRSFRHIDPDTMLNDMPLLFESWDDASVNALKELAKGDAKGRVFFSSGSLKVGDIIAVTDGEQGVGQIRQVESVDIIKNNYFITVDSEFACNPNRNSIVSRITGKPNHTYVCHGDFRDGNCVMIYGISYDIVFNTCYMENINTIGWGAHYTGFSWYGSMKNIRNVNTGYVHNDKPGDDVQYFLSSGEVITGVVFLGMRYEDSSMNVGKVNVKLVRGSSARRYNSYNLILENLDIISETPAIYIDGGGIDGMWIRNVRQYADSTNKAYSEMSPYKDINQARNLVSNDRLWADNLLPEWARMKGDINRDDIVSLVDLEILSEYIAGLTELSPTDKNVANMNGDYNGADAIIDARDFLYLRAMLKYRDDAEVLDTAIREIGVTKVKHKDKNFNLILDYDKTNEED